MSALQARGAEARRCYNAALRTDQTLAGRIMVGVTVAEDGSVCDARVLKSDMPEAMTACALGLFSDVDEDSYPAPVGGCVVVNVPMAFVLPGGEDAH
jgi:hypothetical protein